MACCGQSNKTPSQPPPLATQAVTASKAVVRLAKAVVTHKAINVDAATMAARLAKCKACSKVRLHKGTDFLLCLVCGCGLNGKLRRKAALATESCPEGHWAAFKGSIMCR